MKCYCKASDNRKNWNAADFTFIVWELALVLNEMVCKSELIGLAVMLSTCIREIEWCS